MTSTDNTFLNKVLNLSVAGIYVYDLVQGHNVYINEQYTNLTGYTLNDINSMSQEEFFNLFHPDDQPAIHQHMQDVVNSTTGDVIEIIYRFKKADGSWIWCLSRDAIFSTDEEKKPTQFMGTFIDITTQKNAQQELEQLISELQMKNEELEQLTYVVSHDLKEPIKNVNALIDLLKKQYEKALDEKGFNILDKMEQANARMTSLVQNLLDFRKIGENKKITDVNCQELVSQVLEDLSAKLNATGAKITINKLPVIRGYETELRLLFQNLISNGIKFSQKGISPDVTVDAQIDRDTCLFSVSDNGIGIAPEHRKLVFGIFQRLHPKQEFEGSGIGLAHCKKIVNLHNGRIWVESMHGRGSTFYVELPVTEY